MRQVRNTFRARLAATLIETLVAVVLAVLAAILVLLYLQARRHPWGSSEMSRRTACFSTVSQFAKAMESYCNDYSGYYPCYPGYGLDPCDPSAGVTYSEKTSAGATEIVDMSGLIPNSAVQANPKAGTGDTVGAAFAGVNFFRTCFFGKGRGPAQQTGPVGLGTLLTAGYFKAIPNPLRVFLCPSSSQMPADWGAANAACNSTELKRLGGLDANSLTQGNWAKLKGTWQNVPGVCGFQSSYSYRGVPISDAANCAGTKVTSVVFPDVKDGAGPLTADVGCPQFKTQKSLAGRAIVSDTFSRWADATMPKEDRAGFARFAHRDGYNVLYGDYHARWLGDPSQRSINWNETVVPYVGRAEHSASIAGVTKITGTGPRVYDQTAATPDTEGFEIWHYFDTQSGLDTK